ncbi:hypothetical protein SAMN02746089_00664 [Caldanaerobius fijiensis DSM 17918]|uniref:Uncharacterized protein n=1 Tax=Caldanaerobius fijiensis DSM 17918 TaxID=1121256 RepID=A0A1M4VLM2_9THEO|nr:hypothetical protein [Caldanaerobius fijiensis]SHE69986.1 hypothetical protein SAMN02746089_00664 [Caldanaerobius fijiensis DSM 17918]
MNNKILKVSLTLFLITMLILNLNGCKPKKKPNIPKNLKKTSAELPKPLTSLKEDLDKLYKSLEKVINEKIMPKPSTSESRGGQQGGQSKQQGKTQSSQKSSKASEKGKAGEKPAPSPEQKVLSDATKIVDKIHKDWNDLQPELTKNGASSQMIEQFSNNLNALTSSLKTNNPATIAVATNETYKFIPDFMALFKAKNIPGIYRVIYQIRNIFLKAYHDNWSGAKSDIASLNREWATLRASIEQKQVSIANKIDYSIKELEKAIDNKDKSLIKIESEILNSNINSLEKAIKK